MASKKIRPTPPPGGPALVPALGALLLGLSGPACGGDDGESSSDTANDSQPPMVASEGPMPNPTDGTTTAIPPMIPPSTSTGESADTGTSTAGETDVPPMIPPDTTTTDGSGSGSDGGSSSTGPIPPMPPPMPPPDGGAAPEDQEI